MLKMSEQNDDSMNCILIATANGFSVEQALAAQSVVGDNPDMVLGYLMQ